MGRFVTSNRREHVFLLAEFTAPFCEVKPRYNSSSMRMIFTGSRSAVVIPSCAEYSGGP